MKLAYLTSDARDAYGTYDRPFPYFGVGAGRLLEALRQLPGMEIHVISCTRKRVLAPEKLHPNVWFHSLPVPRMGWSRAAYAGCVLAVRRLLRSIRPDVVHGQGTERDCALSAAFSGYPNVVTVRGNMRRIANFYHAPILGYHWMAAKLEPVALRKTKGVICITHYALEQVRGLAGRTWVVPNAVNPIFFSLNAVSEFPPRILCVGTLCPHKNQLILVHAMERLAQDHDFRLVFVGEGKESDSYFQRFLMAVRSHAWCEYRGSLDEKGILDEFRRSSLLVHPTLEDNCPNVVLEAMAAGIPVVAGRVGGVPDLVEEGVTGYLVDPTDEAALRDRIAGILESSTLQQKMGEQARIVALQKFNPQVIAQKHAEIYQQVIDPPRRIRGRHAL